MRVARRRVDALSLHRKSTRPRTDPAIPTINVVFLLLLFFILAGSLAAPQESDIDPAKVGEGPGSRLPRPLLTITKGAALALDGRAIPREGLAGAIASLSEAPDGRVPTLHVLAARDLPAATLVSLLQEATLAGAATSLVVLKSASPIRPALP